MEKLSINTSKKALLAVALVIFMLVAFLGLAVLTSNAAFASADNIAVGAAFSDASATAHDNSSTTQLYYNTTTKTLTYVADGDKSYFDVAYTFTMNSNTIDGYQIKLNSTGFKVIGITIGETAMPTVTEGDDIAYSLSVDGVDYMATNGFQTGSTANLLITTTANITSLPVITVRYELAAEISVYTTKTIGMTSRYHVAGGSYVTVSSSTVAVTVRSATAMSITASGKTYDATPLSTPTVSYTATESGGPDLADPTEGWASGNQTDAGTYTYNASAAATEYYEAASATTTATVSPLAVTVAPVAKTSVYSTTPAELTYSFTPATGSFTDFDDRDEIEVTFGGEGASITTASTVGTYQITIADVDGTGIDNYTVTSTATANYVITRHHVAVPTVTIYNNNITTGTTITAGTTEEKTFNGKTYSFNYTVDPTDTNSNAIYTHGSTGADILNVGSSTLTLTVGDNYYWGAEGVAVGSQDTAAKTFTIQVNKANITVYLHHAAITYRDAAPTTGYTLGDDAEGLLYNEDLTDISLTQSDFSTTYAVGSPVGTYNIAVAEDSDSRTAIETFLSNYNVSYNGTDQLTVGKLTVTATNDWIAYASGSGTYTYDTAAHGIVAVPAEYTMTHSDTSAVICNVVLSGGDNSNGTQTHVSGDQAAVTLTATFTLKGDDAEDDYGNVITDNYTLAEGVQTKNVTINRKAINITANPKSITYGDAFANDGVTYGEFAGEETSAILTGTLAYATDYVAEAENAKRVVGTYYIRPSGLSNNDYAITYVDGVLTVGKKTVSITWSTPNTWIYDGSAHIVSATIGETEYSETITAAAYNTDTALTNVGSSSRSVTSLSDDDNYAIPENSQAFSVTVRTVTVGVTAASDFTYDSASHTIFTVAVSNLVGTESLTFAYTETGHDASGSSAVYKNGSYTFAGEWADDYTLVFTGISAGVAGDSQTAGAATNYTLEADEEKSMTIEKYTFTWAAADPDVDDLTWTAPTAIQTGDSITFAYSLKLGGVEKLSANTDTSYTAVATGVYTLSVIFSGTEAPNYNEIADQTFTVYSVTFQDTASEHTSEPTEFARVTYYAFAGESVAAHTAWALNGYDWMGWKYTPESSEITYDAPALSASLTVRATWQIRKYQVRYYYRLAGTDGWSLMDSYLYVDEDHDNRVNFDSDLITPATKVWFSNIGWKAAADLAGDTLTKMRKTPANPTTDFCDYYTEYTYAIGNGDVNGSTTVTADDATLIRQAIVGGYAISDHIVASYAAAWAISDAGNTNAYTYLLIPSADVDGDGELGSADVTALNRAIAGGYNFVRANSNKEVVKTLADDDDTFAVGTGLTAGTTLKVYVNGAAAEYTYSNGNVVLTDALEKDDVLVIVTKRECEAGDWSIALTDNWVKSTCTKA